MSLTLLPERIGPAPSLARPPSLADQFLILRRRWRIVFATAGFTVSFACLCLAPIARTYTATGILLYDPASAATPGDPLNNPADQDNQDAVTASQTAVIASLPAAAMLAGRLNLARRPEFNPSLRPVPWPLNRLPPRLRRRFMKPPPECRCHRRRGAARPVGSGDPGLPPARGIVHQYRPRPGGGGGQSRHAALPRP